jgi:hypothetical protein
MATRLVIATIVATIVATASVAVAQVREYRGDDGVTVYTNLDAGSKRSAVAVPDVVAAEAAAPASSPTEESDEDGNRDAETHVAGKSFLGGD